MGFVLNFFVSESEPKNINMPTFLSAIVLLMAVGDDGNVGLQEHFTTPAAAAVQTR